LCLDSKRIKMAFQAVDTVKTMAKVNSSDVFWETSHSDRVCAMSKSNVKNRNPLSKMDGRGERECSKKLRKIMQTEDVKASAEDATKTLRSPADLLLPRTRMAS